MKKRMTLKIAGVMLGLVTMFHILPAYASPYIAVEGDTFYSISKKYKVGLEALLAANPTIKPKNIYGGLEIQIPDIVKNKAAKVEIASIPSPKTETAKTADKQPTKALSDTTPATEKPAQAKPAEKKAASVASSVPSNVVTVAGRDMKYKKKLNVKATAYTAHPSENGKWGAVDYFGNPLKLGTVAVDPKVIPLGTKLFVTGYQFKHLPQGGYVATASDIGGAVNGSRIDLFVPVSQKTGSTFGVQSVQVYVLK
ncbi:3D domain-containing protein [Paenibacillus sp. ACRRX]|uniref:3D domain-containing protein n=1 Tax=Paenibacillus sp. ACRRX TaxID=2918206 RepID=UPI001EF64E4D|nr:3D domain-containing protein [Paenibacillus sp. ACRRX]MCG7409329.1 3D domain-containing protein [Paenibacillus sp. ACRRX]